MLMGAACAYCKGIYPGTVGMTGAHFHGQFHQDLLGGEGSFLSLKSQYSKAERQNKAIC